MHVVLEYGRLAADGGSVTHLNSIGKTGCSLDLSEEASREDIQQRCLAYENGHNA